MTWRCTSCGFAATALLALAAAPLCAADQPANVPTYQGQKPADKPLPKDVPVYHPESSTPHLIRRSMHAPRPGVAFPSSLPKEHKAPKEEGQDHPKKA